MTVLTQINIRRTNKASITIEPVSIGIPLPLGVCSDIRTIRLIDENNKVKTCQKEVLNYWHDHSIRWVLLDFYVSIKNNQQKSLSVVMNGDEIQYESEINNEIFTLKPGARFFNPVQNLKINNRPLLSPNTSVALRIGDQIFNPLEHYKKLETDGPIRQSWLYKGTFTGSKKNVPINFISRLHYYKAINQVKVNFQVHNPQRAIHKDNLWDLGDPNSIFFNELTFKFDFNNQATKLYWKTDAEQPFQTCHAFNHSIYQDSSGGENWKNENHINHQGKVPLQFCGTRIRADNDEAYIKRPNPVYSIRTREYGLSMAIEDFWQNFPKALQKEGNIYYLSLFPKFFNDQFELQPGEKKLHTFFLQLEQPDMDPKGLDWVFEPLEAQISSEWYEKCKIYPYFYAASDKDDSGTLELISQAIEGPHSFKNKNERADEYGWRNFGDIHADHETAFQEDGDDFPSHYNNQYDLILGSILHYWRSGDRRWREVYINLANHVCDIDIYHTKEDRFEFNGGLFWHTNHYKKAYTATHRCFSSKHKKDGDGSYGGGISLNQLFTTGLIYAYYMTGNRFYKEGVEVLLEFSKNQIKPPGVKNFLIKKIKKQIKNTLQKVKQEDIVYSLDGPGRSAANLIMHFVEAFRYSGEYRYLKYAEQLIRMTAHPDQEIDDLDLMKIELKWMYTMFLQSLLYFLELKKEILQFDKMYYYTVDVIKNYFHWMNKNENLYLENADQLEYPNETWAAQDIRKGIIFYLSAQYLDEKNRVESLDKAKYFFKESLKVLNNFSTKVYTRPIAILLVNWFVYNKYIRENKIEFMVK
jgi:hypothetical protein